MAATEVLLLALTFHAVPSEIAIQSEAPDPCALHDRAPLAVRRLLPGLSVSRGLVETNAELWQLTLESRATTVSMRVTDGGRRIVLAREVPLDLRACAAAADGVALILERYLADLGWVSQAPALGEAGGGETEGRVETPPPETRTSTPGESAPALRLELGLGGQVESDLPVEPRVGGAVKLRLAYADQLHLSMAAGMILPGQSDVLEDGSAAIESSAWFGELAVSLCAPIGIARLCPGAGFAIEGVSANTLGEGIFRHGNDFTLQTRIGLRAGVEFPVTDVITIGTSLLGRFRPGNAEFTVEGATSSHSLPELSVGFALDVWMQIL